ncbi:MAG: nuclear transport factor 2 family protein [Solirubrobacterales bacterium]|nr:nuclear transport factor 2 family protein [Solirubrobacterales bacterium]MBV8944431.1 nuclear transport factor 2 family protein [Solirubrobacterales bacterium]MBV9364056.1 nuclear transport factor 2 family protein [Solirubrobacterales bacterium]MBV9680238.1 nuclear transport factor 2 family protein [Solirubrobacterales bacterium]
MADISASHLTIDRLLQATTDHDLETLVACFAEGYTNETPVHPSRGFHGNAQVRRNWEQIFALVPDLRAEVKRHAVAGDVVWTEWEMTGTRRDGRAHCMRGVIIFGVGDGVIQWARFYLEPVDLNGDSVDDAVRAHVMG